MKSSLMLRFREWPLTKEDEGRKEGTKEGRKVKEGTTEGRKKGEGKENEERKVKKGR